LNTSYNETDKKEQFPYPVLTLGNFDGVHLGHQAIFKRLINRAHEKNGTPIVFTFVPHPLKVIAPKKAPRLLTNYKDKIDLIKKYGIDVVICTKFTKEFSNIAADSFVKNVLCNTIKTKEIFIGANYFFGKGREGSPDLLRKLGKECGFTVTVVDEIKSGEITISSSMIRNLVAKGRVEEASRYLGRNYSVEGVVIEGAKRGKKLLNTPTANLSTINELLPENGVYAVDVDLEGKIYAGATNIGYTPTFGNNKFSFETHILDYEGNLLGKTIRIFFIKRIRDEMKFPSLDALASQLKKDIKAVRNLTDNSVS
jgi:riboflavin kinase/FMN adenylyltransferase